jgi:hypothetical protein
MLALRRKRLVDAEDSFAWRKLVLVASLARESSV